MSDQRRFRWKSGRLTSAPIQDGWAIDLDSRDPSIPNLPLESPAAAASNTDRSAGAQFQTRTTGSRRRQTAMWAASLAGQPAAPAVVPAAAWFTAPRPRRRTVEREIVTPEPLQWNRIAPTMAAILKPERPKVVAFDRKLRVPPSQPTYPATPATGPPLTAWLAAARRAVSQDRRLQRLPEQPVYPATPAPDVTDRTAGESFQTRITRSRRRLTALDAPVYPAAPAVLTAQGFPAWLAPKAHRAEPLERAVQRLEQPAHPPTPPAVSQATIAAVSSQRVKRRKGRAGLFLSAGGSTLSIASTATTPAAYPSFVPTGFLSRRDTERRLIVAPDVIGVAAAPPPPAVTDRTAGPTFQTRVLRSRRLLVAPDVLGVDAAPPVTSNAIITAVTPPRTKRRKGRAGLFLGGSAGSVLSAAATTPAVYPSFVVTGFHSRRDTERRLITAPDVIGVDAAPPAPAVTDRTAGDAFLTRITRSRRRQPLPAIIGVAAAPPVTSEAPISALVAAKSIRRRARPGLFLGGNVSVDGFFVPQPVDAWRNPIAHRAAGLGRRLLREPLQLVRPQTPPTPPQPETAFRLPIKFRAAGLGRQRIPAAPQLEHPETPIVIVPPPLGGDDKPDARRHPGWDRKRSELKRKQELRQADEIRALYRKLQGIPDAAPRVAEISTALRAQQSVEQGDEFVSLAKRVASLDTAAIELELALRLLAVEIERQADEDDELAMALILALI